MTTKAIIMADDARFWDRIAEKYAKKPVENEENYQRKLKVTQDYFRPEMEVLELGCGTGSTALVHAPHVRHIRATDISSKMIEIARGKAADARIDNVTFDVNSVDDIHVEAGSVDAVLAMSLLHLVPDKDAAMAKIHRMLKPGGLFVTSTPCLGDTMKWFKLVGPIGAAVGLIPKVTVMTADEWLSSLAPAGFAIDYQWQPEKSIGVFAVAKKVD